MKEIEETRIVSTGCPAHNCGGRCLLRVHVRDGLITRIETDNRPEDDEAPEIRPQLRACTRGRAYRRRQYHPDRLQRPMRRTGRRGEGTFEEISWDEALDEFAAQLREIRDTYGHGALFVPYGTGGYSQLTGSGTAHRLLNCFGGHLEHYNSYSWGATNLVTPEVYGTRKSGNERQDWLNSNYIIMWGWNPAEARDGTNSDWFILRARERGVRIVCIDPRYTMSAVSLADEWIPIRPGTDTAMMSAMAWVIITEGLVDTDFVRRCCSGFDSSRMPDGHEDSESFSDYILGTRDGVPKTPEWAEAITGVPRRTIARIAREYATAGPAVLYQGYAMQRRAFGEQVVRAGCALAAITGNVGIPGGWASGLASQPTAGPFWTLFPKGDNPHGVEIPTFLWTEAIIRGRELGAEHGVLGLPPGGRLDSDIKLIWSVASNTLVNQHANINRTAAMLRDENLVEYIVVQDNFLTPSGRFADLILPACTQFETWGLADGWKYGQEVILMPQVVEPLGESRSDYRICADLAARLGIEEAYTEGRDERGWVEWILEQYREQWLPDLPGLEEILAEHHGVYSQPVPVDQARVAFADFRSDPEAHPLDTESGKIELFSRAMYERGDPDGIPAVPKYIQEWESPFGPEAERFPLQAIASHSMARVHSTHENVDWLREAFPHRLFINPLDAHERGIADGETVRVFNQRGELLVPCRITPRIMPGVVNLPQGAWWTPDESGTCQRGSINTLTSERWTPYTFGAALQTVMVQVAKTGGAAS